MINKRLLLVFVFVSVALISCVTGKSNSSSNKKASTANRSNNAVPSQTQLEASARKLAEHYGSRDAMIWKGRSRTSVVKNFENRTGTEIAVSAFQRELVAQLNAKKFPAPTPNGENALTGTIGRKTLAGVIEYTIDIRLQNTKSEEILWHGLEKITFKK